MLYNKEVKQIKDQIVKQIIGNYLKGAGENAAYLKEVKASNLGAVFLNYGEAIDLTSETLADYNKSNPKMQSAGTLSLLIKETFDKIDRYAMKCETMEYPTAVVKKDLTKYANSLLDGVNIVAFSEGEADTDLKSDIKILLREGREEFNKRMSEEENEIKEAQDKATQDPTATEDAPTEEEATDDVEDDSDFIEEDTPEEDTDAEEETDETDEEEPEDEEVDYDKLAEDEYGSDEEEAEEKNEDDDIPTGESYFSYGEDFAGVFKSIKNTVKSITGSIAKYWHDISEKARIANEKAKQPRSYSTISPEEKEAQRQKSLDSFNEWFNKYISDMTPYLNSNDKDTCWGSYELARKFLDEIYFDPATALTYGYAYNDVLDIVHDEITTVNKNFVKHMKDTFDVDLSDQVADKSSGAGESFSSYGEGLTDIANKFKAKIKATIEQSKKDKADKKVENFMKNIDSYVETMEEFIYGTDLESCIKAYDLTMDRIYSYIDNARMKQTYGDTYPKIEEALFTKGDELNEEFWNYTRDVFGIEEMESIDIKTPGETGTGESHMFKRKYGHTTIDPQAFSEMINTLLETERDTLKTFAESRGLSFVANSTDYAITSKTLINTTAVVLAARYKFGFYN